MVGQLRRSSEANQRRAVCAGDICRRLVATSVPVPDIEEHSLHQPERSVVYGVLSSRVRATQGSRHVCFAALFEIELDHLLGGFKKILGGGRVKLVQSTNSGHGKDETTATTGHTGGAQVQMATRGAQAVGIFWSLEIQSWDVQKRGVGVEIGDVGRDITLHVRGAG